MLDHADIGRHSEAISGMALDARVALMATAAPLLSATLLGFLPQGHLLVLEARSDGEAILRRMSHDGGTSEMVDRARPRVMAAWVEQRAYALGVRAPIPLARAGDRWQTHGIELSVVKQPALGGRRFVELIAHRGHHAIAIFRMPALGEVEIGPLYPVPNTDTLVVAYAQRGRAGIETVDLSRASATLLNLDALAHFRRGETARAAELWEEAVRAAPREGDAIYNLACLHARMGQLERARRELAVALDIDRVRYRALAREDSDLEPLRADPEVRRQLGLEEDQ